MDGLLIREPWIDKILSGEKTWEIRGSNTKKRGRIALIKSGTGLVYGTAELSDCVPLSHEKYRAATDRHCIPYEQTEEYPYKRTFAWVLKDHLRFDEPKPYKHPGGAVIWVKLGGI